jgi:hypothetical protein
MAMLIAKANRIGFFLKKRRAVSGRKVSFNCWYVKNSDHPKIRLISKMWRRKKVCSRKFKIEG